MQPCSTEMQAGGGGGLNMTSLLNLQDLHPSHFDPISAAQTDHDFLDQMFSSISPTTSPWPELNPSDLNHFDESALLASKLRQHQISSGQQMVMAAGFDPPAQGEALFNGFGGSLTAAPHFPLPQGGISPSQFGAQLPQQVVATSAPAGSAAAAAAGNGQPRQRVRARRGQATDPHSIAERLRRERIAERMKALQELVPNANKTDKASMLDEIIDYVKFLQLQVKVLSMSRLGGASAVAPLVADMSSEVGGSDGGAQPNGGGSDSLTVTEHQVAKLMEEDMGSAMQYLQGKGLCLMPISLATAISAATSHSGGRTAAGAMAAALTGDGPTSPSVSVLTVSSAAAAANGRRDGPSSAKDAASVLT